MSKDGKSASDERAARLAAALKDNLRRRKAQVRNRRDATDDGSTDNGSEDAVSTGNESKIKDNG